MGSNINNTPQNLPIPNTANILPPLNLTPPTYASGFPEIDAFLNATVKQASDAINNNNTMGIDLNTTERLNNNQSLETQNIFSIFSNTPIVNANTPSVFTLATNGALPSSSGLLSIADIIQASPNAIAGPTGSVFGRANNILGLPTAVTKTNNPAFLPDTSGLSQEKAKAVTMLAQQFPELAQQYLQETAGRKQPLNTTVTTSSSHFEGMPSGFSQLYSSVVAPVDDLKKASEADKASTQKLLKDAQMETSKEPPKKD
jgi:hypothetical protein